MIPTPTQYQKLNMSSYMESGQHKGKSVRHLIDTHPTYLTYIRKRRWVSLSHKVAMMLAWRLTGNIDKRLQKSLDVPDKMSYKTFRRINKGIKL